jgi:glycosyltransferase involved in cell wall biosynthesis
MDSIYQGISVIICCYNSAKRLPETLRYLSSQAINDWLKWEIIIVDNASTDNTSFVAEEILAPLALPNFSFQIVSEQKPGLSFARYHGVQTAKYHLIVFCDDDNWLDKNYLQHAFTIMESDKTIGALGGQSYVVSDGAIPEWFEEYQEGYAVGKQGDQTGYVTQRGYVWGAGLVTRKELFLTTINEELPSLLTDRKGTELTSGGDNEYCQRLILLGYQLYYCEQMVFGHFVTANRLSAEYRDKLYKCFEVSSGVVYYYTEAIHFKRSNTLTKIKLLGSATSQIIINVLRGKKISHRSIKIFYYFLGWGYKTNRELRVVKRFYDA